MELRRLLLPVDTLQENKTDFTDQLASKSRELQKASQKFNALKSETVQREKLMMRYETLRSERDEADKLLREKCIVPRSINAETNRLVQDLYDEIDQFRYELRESTQKVETLTNRFEMVEAEKTEQIAKLDQSLKTTVEERNSLQQEVATLRRMKDTLLVDKESQQQLIEDRNHEIDTLRETLVRLEIQLEDAKIEANKLKDELQFSKEIQQATTLQIDKIQRERHSSMEQMTKMAVMQNEWNDEKQRIEAKLADKERYMADAEQSLAAKDAQAIILENKLKGVVSELQSSKETTEAYAESLRQAVEFRTLITHQLEVKANELSASHERIESLKNELNRTNISLRNCTDELADLHRTNDSLASKCTKLRDYIRKVTKKCHEWEVYHDRETAAVRHLHQAYNQSCRKALALSTVCKEKDEVRFNVPLREGEG
jgi:chromosome segregation ATPase